MGLVQVEHMWWTIYDANNNVVRRGVGAPPSAQSEPVEFEDDDGPEEPHIIG
jgi:hypothetical protein